MIDHTMGDFSGGSAGKESTWKGRRLWFDPWAGEIPWRREWPTSPIFLPRESDGQRSLEGYSPWGHKEMDMTEQLTLWYDGRMELEIGKHRERWRDSEAGEGMLEGSNTLDDEIVLACLLAKLLQSCPTLCNPIDGSPPGSPVPGILQARTLEWVAMSFSNAWKWKMKVKLVSRVQL